MVSDFKKTVKLEVSGEQGSAKGPIKEERPSTAQRFIIQEIAFGPLGVMVVVMVRMGVWQVGCAGVQVLPCCWKSSSTDFTHLRSVPFHQAPDALDKMY